MESDVAFVLGDKHETNKMYEMQNNNGGTRA
jgi:hypothetical protein